MFAALLGDKLLFSLRQWCCIVLVLLCGKYRFKRSANVAVLGPWFPLVGHLGTMADKKFEVMAPQLRTRSRGEWYHWTRFFMPFSAHSSADLADARNEDILHISMLLEYN